MRHALDDKLVAFHSCGAFIDRLWRTSVRHDYAKLQSRPNELCVIVLGINAYWTRVRASSQH